MNTRASVLATLNCYLMMLLWTVTEGSRFSTATQEVLNRSHQSAGDLRRNDSHSWFQGRYNQEYPHDSLHELMKAGTRKRYILSDYQDFSLSEAQHTLYKEYDNRVSHPGATVLLPRSREEREEDLTRRNRGGGKQNKSDAIQVDGEAVLITPSAVVDIGAPDTATEEAEDNTVTEDVNLQIRQIFNAEDLQKAGRPLCRSRENYLPPEFFSADSCALCYGYLQNKDFFHTKWLATDLLKTMTEGGRSYVYSVTVLFNPKNISQVEEAVATSEVLLETFSGEVGRAKWRSCCHAAVQCCENMLTASWPSSSCPNTWDGWQCWPATLPNTEINKPCPSYIYHGKGPSCAKEASKRCEEDGQWFRREGRHEWSNYSSCSVEENIHRRLHVHIAAYSISVAALFPALCIFFSYKQLRVHRITLHKHLFLSLLLEALGVIIFRLLQLYKNDLIQQNPAWCVTLNLLTKYTSVTNYMWYLCEGFYLHKLLVSAFAEQNNLTIFYLIGWGFPLIPLTIYSVSRGLGHHNTHCWIVPVESLEWIINLPPLLAIVINIIFVVNIIRILVSKVRATTANEPSQYRKAVRATMMVVPLFGLQYIVTIYRHQVLGCDWQDLYQIFNNMIEGSTGAIVAIIFCYTNGEVKALLKRTIDRKRASRAPRGVLSGEAHRSRSLSTVQTTLLQYPSPARRKSSVVSICANSQPFCCSNSTADSSQLLNPRGSRSSNTQQPADNRNTATSRKLPKIISNTLELEGSEIFGQSRSPLHNLNSIQASGSPSLSEEVDDVEKIFDEKHQCSQLSLSIQRSDNIERYPVVLFRKDNVEPCVNFNLNGLRTSVDQGYESSHNTGTTDE